jgi:hypothetical protein
LGTELLIAIIDGTLPTRVETDLKAAVEKEIDVTVLRMAEREMEDGGTEITVTGLKCCG